MEKCSQISCPGAQRSRLSLKLHVNNPGGYSLLFSNRSQNETLFHFNGPFSILSEGNHVDEKLWNPAAMEEKYKENAVEKPEVSQGRTRPGSEVY